jgi:hypothetical protein
MMITRFGSMTRYVMLLAVIVTGCSGGPPSLSGTVTLDGKPLAAATITLHPAERNSGAQLVVGVTGSDGRFVITPAAGKSIAPGAYKVTVSKRREPTPAEQRAMIVPPEMLPAKYSELGKTELSVTVPTSGEVDLQLTR